MSENLKMIPQWLGHGFAFVRQGLEQMLVGLFLGLRDAIESLPGLILLYGALIYYLSVRHWLMLIALALSLCAHEFGHWFSARKQGFEVDVFSLGLPSKRALRLFNFRGTRFQITPYWFFGGFITLDMAEEKVAASSAWRRAIVMSAGIFVNIVLAFVGFSASYLLNGKPVNYGELPVIVELLDGASAARQAGLRQGDLIMAVGARGIDTRSEFAAELSQHKNELVNLTILREQELKDILVKPDDAGHIGVATGSNGVRSVRLIEAVSVGARQTVHVVVEISQSILILTGLESPAQGANSDANRLHGVLAIVQMGANAFSQSLSQFIFVVAALNSNLAVVNLIPLPVLDGGQLVFIAAEKLRRRRLSIEMQIKLSQFFMIVMLGLAFMSLYNDIVHPFKPG